MFKLNSENYLICLSGNSLVSRRLYIWPTADENGKKISKTKAKKMLFNSLTKEEIKNARVVTIIKCTSEAKGCSFFKFKKNLRLYVENEK